MAYGVDLSDYLFPEAGQGRQPAIPPQVNPAFAPGLLDMGYVTGGAIYDVNAKKSLGIPPNTAKAIDVNGAQALVSSGGSGSLCYVNAAVSASGLTTASWVFSAHLKSGASYPGVVWGVIAGGSQRIYISLATDGTITLNLKTANFDTLTTWTFTPPNGVNTRNFVINWLGGYSANCYADGQLCSVSQSNGTAISTMLSGQDVFLNDISYSAGFSFSGFARFNRSLDAATSLSLSVNPWQLFDAPIYIPFSAPASGGTTSATIAPIDGVDVSATTAAVWTTAQISSNDGADTTAASASVTTCATIASSDSADIVAAIAKTWTTAQISSNDGADANSENATITTGCSIASIDGPDNTNAISATWTTSQIVATDSADSVYVGAQVGSVTSAGISTSDAVDSASVSANVWTTAQIATTDNSDVFAETTSVTTGGAIALGDSADTTAAIAALWTTSQISASDSSDAAMVVAANFTAACQIVAVDKGDTATAYAVNWTNSLLSFVDAADQSYGIGSVTTGATLTATDNKDKSNITAAQFVALVPDLKRFYISALGRDFVARSIDY